MKKQTKQVELPERIKNWNWEAIGDITGGNPDEAVAIAIAEAQQEAVERERERCVDIVKNEISRQNGLRCGCPYCGNDLCDCEGGRKTALRILEALQKEQE